MSDTQTSDAPYELYVYDLSYFSGKMQAYLRYRELPHRVTEASWMQLAFELVEEAGVMEVPLVRRPDGTLMRDTSSMIAWFEAREHRAPLVPEDPALAFIMRLLEDYADEGLWRPALYYRWAFELDAQLYARRIMDDFLHLPGVVGPLRPLQRANIIARQRRVYLRGEGVTDTNRGAVEQHYLDELDDLQTLLAARPFIFGERPSLVDFGYFASMFRHFSLDPTPSKLMRERAPAVYAWVARMWAARVSPLERAPLLDWDAAIERPALRQILARVGRLYLPYLLANARAVASGRPHFEVELDGHRYPHLSAIPFRAWSRTELTAAHTRLDPSARERVDQLLGASGCSEALLAEPELDPRYPDGARLPECRPRRLGRLAKLRLLWTGTPHHIEVEGS